MSAATVSAMADQHRVAGQRGDLAVEEAVGVAPAAPLPGVGSGPGLASIASSSARRSASARAALRRPARRRRARAARAPRAARTGWRRAREAGPRGERVAPRGRERVGGDERARRRGASRPAPRTCSAAIASRTEARPTSSRRARSRSDGSRSPGAKPPAADRRRAAARRSARSAGDAKRPVRSVCERTGRSWRIGSVARPGSVPGMAATFKSVDPRTGAGRARRTTRRRPTDVARRGGRAPRGRRARAGATATRRAALLRGAAARLRAAGDEIVALGEAETGLPEARLRSASSSAPAGQLEAVRRRRRRRRPRRGDHRHRRPRRQPIPRPDVRRMLVPLGPVAVFGASNFPLAFSAAGGDTASALAAGCPVVVKGHPSHPGTGELVAARASRAAVADAGLPDGHVRARAGRGARGRRGARRRTRDRRGRLHRLDSRRPRAASTAPPPAACRSPSTPRWASSTRSW